MPKIYLDACCINRLTDDQTQRRIREEAGAIELILRRFVRKASHRDGNPRVPVRNPVSWSKGNFP